ncbi:N-ethylmaleimide reductase [Pseudomonas fluorescens]|uniref:hypothetical protein n=1 Tax=Pseudomonas fluorescens TaxID=294 RepID=UPI00125C7DBC|nr:hypothetical protein [Pseudomonas fluorescens]VVP37356.1 N-ethylmaleimide reductase [Pseudomonas fluorescens]
MGSFEFRELKRRFGRTYIATERAETSLREGNADLVSFGTAFLANPDLLERFEQGVALNDADPTTFYPGEERGYTDYPTMAQIL